MELKDWLALERGRATQLARHLTVPASFISKMASAEKPVPLDHCPFIQEFTKGEVTCEELRPDAAEYFALIRGQAAANDAGPPATPLPHGVVKDRRDPTRVNPFPDLNRRAPAGEGAA